MYSDAYIRYLVHFHGDRDYFECHEILEEHWKQTSTDKQSIWVGFILLAVSNYHYRRGNYSGAFKSLNKALTIFQKQITHGVSLGIDCPSLITLLHDRSNAIQSGLPYASFNIPFSDSDLVNRCQQICQEKGYIWGTDSDPKRIDLIHRHALRDRSEVILERKAAIEIRNKKKAEND